MNTTKRKKNMKLAASKNARKRRITRAEARKRAERYVVHRMFKGAKVRDGAEVRLGVYLRGDWTPTDVWVVFKNQETNDLKSSEIILLSKHTGRVLYEGSARDEG